MKRTQRLIVILGDPSLINQVSAEIAAFHAVTVIKSLSSEILQTVFHYNKNAVFFASSYDMTWSIYTPIVIRLDNNTDVGIAVLGIDNIISDFPKVLEPYDVDTGDHSSEDSTQIISYQSTDECLLCNILRRQTTNVEHILYETESFYIVPGTGAFFPGYIMIVPKEHVMSFALLSPNKLEEFFSLLNDVRSILEGIYNLKVFAFECGSGRTGTGKHKTSIVHAHFHLAPTNMPVLKEVHKSGLHPALINKQDLGIYSEYPYMLYVDQDDNWYISSDPNAYYPRQHPRQVLANWMNCYEYYNWRVYPYRERMDIIADEFRGFCHKNFDTLPKWVQKAIRFTD